MDLNLHTLEIADLEHGSARLRRSTLQFRTVNLRKAIRIEIIAELIANRSLKLKDGLVRLCLPASSGL